MARAYVSIVTLMSELPEYSSTLFKSWPAATVKLIQQ